MYESFYQLRERPFDLTPNPRFLLLTRSHREALSNLQYGLASRRGLTLLIGEAGTGKTTLMRAVVGEFEEKGARIAYLNNPTLTRQEFAEFLADAFGLDSSAASSKTRLLAELGRVLASCHANGVLTGLIIDESQSLPDELLEEIRLLANIETTTDKLLPVVLAGQPELSDRLNQQSLRQLKQRVALRCQLGALGQAETAEYIAGRIRIAGGNSMLLFTRQAVDAIYKYSGGIPRLISVICDNALISGFAADRRPVNRDLVEEVCRDFDLTGPQGSAPPPDTPAPPQTGGAAAGAPAADPGGAHRDAEAEVLAGAPHESRGMFELFSMRRRFSFF
jgi:general secretion pathway protein A